MYKQQQETDLQALMWEQKKNPQLDLRHKIDAARLALNLNLIIKAQKHLHWSRHRFYTLLGRKLIPHPYNSALPKLCLCDGKLTQNLQLVVQEFCTFYSKLYASLNAFPATLADKYFRDIPFT